MRPQKALPFAIANSQWASLGATIALTGDLTVEAWVNRSMVNIAGDGFKDVVTGHSGTSGPSINFYADQARWYDGSTDQVIASATTAAGWHHHAWVRSGTSVLYYRDGVLDTSSTGTNNSSGTVNFTSIGLGDGAGYYLDGQLQELRVWNVARSATQIAAHYNTTVDPASSGLVAYYDFGESPDGSTTVTDLVAGTYSGTLQGSPTATRVAPTAPIIMPWPSDPPATIRRLTGRALRSTEALPAMAAAPAAPPPPTAPIAVRPMARFWAPPPNIMPPATGVFSGTGFPSPVPAVVARVRIAPLPFDVPPPLSAAVASPPPPWSRTLVRRAQSVRFADLDVLPPSTAGQIAAAQDVRPRPRLPALRSTEALPPLPVAALGPAPQAPAPVITRTRVAQPPPDVLPPMAAAAVAPPPLDDVASVRARRVTRPPLVDVLPPLAAPPPPPPPEPSLYQRIARRIVHPFSFALPPLPPVVFGPPPEAPRTIRALKRIWRLILDVGWPATATVNYPVPVPPLHIVENDVVRTIADTTSTRSIVETDTVREVSPMKTRKVGDTADVFSGTLYSGGAPRSLAGSTVKLYMWDSRTHALKINGVSCAVEPSGTGTWSYQPIAADVDTAGEWEYDVEETTAAGRLAVYPSSGYGKFVTEERVG
jgi:hypothetical protein